MRRMFNAVRIPFPRWITGHTLSTISSDPDELRSYILRWRRRYLSVNRATLLHTTRHSFPNSLRTHLENMADFFVIETIAKVKLQNCRIFWVHLTESLLHDNACDRLIFRSSRCQAVIQAIWAVYMNHLPQAFSVQVAQAIICGNTIDPGIQLEFAGCLAYFLINLQKSILGEVKSYFSIPHESM